MTKRLWQLHSWLGLVAGLGVLVIGCSGSLLVFRDQVDGWLSPEVMRVEPTAAGRLSWNALHAGAQRAWPEYVITGFGPRNDPHLAELVYVRKRGGHEYLAGTLNPYTGEALAAPMDSTKTFTGILLELHYTWFANHVGMLITGIFAVLLCLLGLTGVWLYRGFWKSFFTLRWGRSARIFFSDLHKMVGISSVIFNLILGFTGAYWNISHVAEDGLGEHEDIPEAAEVTMNPQLSLETMKSQAAEKIAGFRTNWISFPDGEETNVTLWGSVPSSHPFSGDYGSSAVFDSQSGVLKDTMDMRHAELWEKFADTFASLHYGTFGGLPVKILWSVLGLAPGLLAVSGFLIWYRRRSSLRISRAP